MANLRQHVTEQQVNISNKTSGAVKQQLSLPLYSSTVRIVPRLSRLAENATQLAAGKSLSVMICERRQLSAAKRIQNPSNAPSTLIQKPLVKESISEAWRRYQNNWKWIFRHSVGPGSKLTYSTAWNSYRAFCTSVGITDLFLDVPSQTFIEESISVDGFIGGSPFDYKTLVILSYISAMYGDSDKKLMHSTIGTYLSGIRHFFDQAHKSTTFFDAPIISQTRSSLQYLWAQKNSLAETQTLPITCDMFVYARDVYFKNMPSSWENRGILVGMIIAFCCLFRMSELLITSANHYLRGQDVVFEVASGPSTIKSIHPSKAYLYLLQDVRSVAITVHSAKNDWQGEGHRMYFRTVNDTAPRAFELVREMFAWAQEARPRYDDAFLMYKGTFMVSYENMSAAIKAIASALGFDPSRFSMHSLRIGGASALAASGAPTHYIQKMGRWKSLAFLRYIHWAVGGMADALKILSNPGHFTADDLRKINPGVVLAV